MVMTDLQQKIQKAGRISVLNKNAFHWLLIGLIILITLPISAAADETEERSIKKTSFFILPIFSYAPETRWVVGTGGIFTFRSRPDIPDQRPSFVPFKAVYTQNKQFVFTLEPEITLQNGSTIITGLMELKEFPDMFYGIGNDSRAVGGERYTPRQVSFEISLQKRLRSTKNLFVGLYYGYDHYRFRPFDPEGRLATGDIFGSRGGAISGAGVLLKWDTRDNVFFPTQGHHIQISANLQDGLLGSRYEYAGMKVEAMAYIPMFRNQVLGIHGIVRGVSGNVPFMALPSLGGEEILRGYNGALFRDRILAAAQAEYRIPLWKRWGLAVFAGLGEVADRFGHLEFARLKYSIGLGIRFRISPAEGTNLRLDLGFGQGYSGTYITAGEAF